MRTINEIILHCSATPEGKDYKEADIDKWHRQKGWAGCGYHFVVDLDGKVEKGRDITKSGAHCTGHNTGTIGICYIGGLAKDGKTAKDTRTAAQKDALQDLVYLLLRQYHLSLDNVKCHYQYANKACPSFKIEAFKEEYKKAFEINKRTPNKNIIG